MIAPNTPYGFFTDTTICIGCKACEVACKQWNSVGMDGLELSGFSYDNTVRLGAETWRHVAFVEQPVPLTVGGPAQRWLMLSDVCKHCTNAGCLDACPTGALIRTEFDTVVVQPDICNGCGYCVPACPFGVIEVDLHGSGLAQKCTLCYDRLRDGLEPACAMACPTDSIIFGDMATLADMARGRVEFLQQAGMPTAALWGLDDKKVAGGVNAFFLIADRPEVYGLPVTAVDPVAYTPPAARSGVVAALISLLFTLFVMRRR
jgi:formate dehydrogenase iron-sulfur subunit